MPLSKIQDIGNQVIPNLGRSNIVINGAMKVAQRGTTTGQGGAEAMTAVDRFKIFGGSTAGRLTSSQDSDSPVGFGNSLKLDCTTADTSVAAGEFLLLEQRIEGQDLQQLKYNQSSAETSTISFYVKGNASAQYTFALQYHLSGGTARWFTKGFAVTTDWTRVVITIPGDTQASSGSDYGIADNNATGANLMIWLHGGTNFSSGTHQDTAWADRDYTKLFQDNQTSFYDSTDRTFLITGFQFEVGDSASDFNHRSISEELDLCHRYFYKPVTADVGNYSPFLLNFGNTVSTGSNGYFAFNVPLPKPMRAIPTFTHNLSNSNHAGSGTGANVGNWQFYWQNQGWGNYAGSGNMNTLNRAMSGTTSVHLGNYYITPSTTYFDQITVGRDLTFQFESEL